MLNRCPQCGNFHRGRAVVCRPCAKDRLESYVSRRLGVSRETVDSEAERLANDVTVLMQDLARAS